MPANRLELHSVMHGYTYIEHEPTDRSSVIDDVALLFDAFVYSELVPNTQGIVEGWYLLNSEENVWANHDPGDGLTTIHIDELHLPLQGIRWAAVQLYVRKMGQEPLPELEIEFSSPGVDTGPTDFGILHYTNDRELSLSGILGHLSDEIFTEPEHRRALAQMVGASDLAVFQETWDLAEGQPSPYAAAHFLLGQASRFS